MPKSSNSKKESNVKNKPQEQRESRSGGFLKLLKNIIEVLFKSTIDLPQKAQNEMRNIDRQQGLDSKGKSPEDLKSEKKREVKKAAEGLKEGIKKSDAGNQSVGIEVPNQATTQDIDSSKTMER